MFTTRAWANRKIRFAVGNIETAEDHIVQVAQEYKLHYPDEYDYFCAAIQMLDTMKEILKALKV